MKYEAVIYGILFMLLSPSNSRLFQSEAVAEMILKHQRLLSDGKWFTVVFWKSGLMQTPPPWEWFHVIVPLAVMKEHICLALRAPQEGNQ